MNYLRIYDNIIAQAKQRNSRKGGALVRLHFCLLHISSMLGLGTRSISSGLILRKVLALPICKQGRRTPCSP